MSNGPAIESSSDSTAPSAPRRSSLPPRRPRPRRARCPTIRVAPALRRLAPVRPSPQPTSSTTPSGLGQPPDELDAVLLEVAGGLHAGAAAAEVDVRLGPRLRSAARSGRAPRRSTRPRTRGRRARRGAPPRSSRRAPATRDCTPGRERLRRPGAVEQALHPAQRRELASLDVQLDDVDGRPRPPRRRGRSPRRPARTPPAARRGCSSRRRRSRRTACAPRRRRAPSARPRRGPRRRSRPGSRGARRARSGSPRT